MFNVFKSKLKLCQCKIYASKCSTRNFQSSWKSVVGLEVHAQISSNSKLFSGAKSDFSALVNDCVSPFDASVPGTLPVLNRRCVEAGVKTALALSCRINPVSMFDRKHYFYADLPTGYQITQQRAPIAQDGQIQFQVVTHGSNKKPYTKVSKIKQIQLEQDSGKSLHDEDLQHSLLDLNRAGNPLIEVVFEPDLEDGEEAASLVKELILILTRIKCCSCRMEEGALRVDANISVHRPGEPLGTRTEIKNIFSIRAVANAVKHEINRQIEMLENGGIITNETRSWDAIAKVTVPMRDKEEKQDYRYMPEPNLPPLRLNVSGDDDPNLVNVLSLQKEISELPEETREKLINKYGLPKEIAIKLVKNDILLQYFLEICDNSERNSSIVANVLFIEFLGIVNKHKIPIEDCIIRSEWIGQLVDLKDAGEINTMIMRRVLEMVILGAKESPKSIIETNDWKMIKDPKEIEKICINVINDNPKVVNQYKNGKTKVFSFLTKAAVKATDERVDVALVIAKLEELLKNDYI